MKQKIECDVCHHEFYINKNDVYQINIYEQGVFLLKKEKIDAIDCPECGCQKLLKRRFDKNNLNCSKECFYAEE